MFLIDPPSSPLFDGKFAPQKRVFITVLKIHELADIEQLAMSRVGNHTGLASTLLKVMTTSRHLVGIESLQGGWTGELTA